jgi:dienelactone hydrolase
MERNHADICRRAALLLLAGISCYAADLAQEVRSLRPGDTSATEKSVLDNLEQRAKTALAGLKHPQTSREADRLRPKLRQQLQMSLGLAHLPWPPKLQPQPVGSVLRVGYRIEKVVFQSLPAVSVPAHLYIPDDLRGRAPAVLFYVGHWWPDSKARPDFQAFCINMARLGFVVLTWDPFGQGERGISSRDHRRTETLPVGVSQQGIAEYETRCALEYLLSRPEVDPQRIGMTGASGGGYNTWITAATDDRIKVAVPVVGTSEFYEQISVTRPLDWYHASEHCHFVPGLIKYANNHEFIAMAAPKPLMIIAASQDQSFPIRGVRDVYEYGRGLYGSYGSAGKIAFFEDQTEGHGYQKRKREAAYGWFLRWLKNQGDAAPVPEPETIPTSDDSAKLRCFPPGDNRAAGPGIIETVQRIAAKRSPQKLGESFLAAMSWPASAGVSNVRIRDVPVQRVIVPIEPGLNVPAFVLRPQTAIRGVLIAVDDRGKEEVLTALAAEEILASGWAVMGVDPRGIGEMKTTQMGWAAAVSLLLNENFVARQAFDLARAVDVARQWFAGRPAAVYARGDNASLAATYVVGSDRNLKFYLLRDGFISYRHFYLRPKSMAVSFELKRNDRDRTTAFDREIPFAYVPFAAMHSFDLPGLLASSPAPGLIVNPINGDWVPIEHDEARKILPARVKLATGSQADVAAGEFIRSHLN